MSTDRKAAIAAYKERKETPGIFAVRSRATGRTWVGTTPTLGTAENRHRFDLRMRSHPCRPLQETWNTHGGDDLSFEVLERLKDGKETDARRIRAWLKKRSDHWCAHLGVDAI